ncbi:MAG TPA: Uma2 family endonuclease [Kofleriaceae bacterium]
MSFDTTERGPDLPPVDARLAPPETRYEVHDGVLVYVPPCDEPHGRRQSKICALIEAYAARDFTVASEMLTRTSKTNDFAPDVSVYPKARDPDTGGRQLEHLAFEVVSTESLSHAGRKATKLVGRGVRRVFAINIERSRALEWSPALGTWSVLDSSDHIEDRSLALTLPIAALLTAAEADGPMARALIAKKTPEIEEVIARGRQEGFAEGVARGRAEAVIAILDARSIALDTADRARILGELDLALLERWLVRAATCDRIGQLFDV